MMNTLIRVRMSAHDAHYGGDLVDGARVLQLFGDVCTEICIRNDGDEGLFRAYHEIEFLAPVFSGDFLEVCGELTHVGRTSREVKLTAHKVIAAAYEVNDSAARVLEEPILVCKAAGVCVVPLEKQKHRAEVETPP
jgi:3-aminobutyryl-CoA ammonia-lyase